MADRRPQDLVFTLFGEFLLHRRGPVWVGSLIALLEPLGVSESNVRTVLSRMMSKGWFRTIRQGRRSYYELSERGRRLLEEGEARIYHPPRDAPWDGEWTLVAYSIPEERRELRDRLRLRLSWLGFGSLGNGLWISPHDAGERVREAAAELDVDEHLEAFRGAHLGVSDADRLVEKCWNLEALNERYEAFIDRHLSGFLALKEGGADTLSEREAYVRRFELVHEYREFPLLDPYLPRPLHTPDWAGECAESLLKVYREALRESADRFVGSRVETPSVTHASATA